MTCDPSLLIPLTLQAVVINMSLREKASSAQHDMEWKSHWYTSGFCRAHSIRVRPSRRSTSETKPPESHPEAHTCDLRIVHTSIRWSPPHRVDFRPWPHALHGCGGAWNTSVTHAPLAQPPNPQASSASRSDPKLGAALSGSEGGSSCTGGPAGGSAKGSGPSSGWPDRFLRAASSDLALPIHRPARVASGAKAPSLIARNSPSR